jgi:hypothetical protein
MFIDPTQKQDWWNDLPIGTNLAGRIEEAELASNQAVSVFGSNGKCPSGWKSAEGRGRQTLSFGLLHPNKPKSFQPTSGKFLKRNLTTGLEPAASAVTGQRTNVSN